MSKTINIKGIYAYLFVIGCILMVGGAIWSTYNYFQIWDLVMSKKQMILYSWKSNAIMLVGFFLFYISVDKSK